MGSHFAEHERTGRGEGTFSVRTAQRAVVDRIVDGKHVVLLVGPDEVERIVERSLLPEDIAEGTWLKVEFDGDQLVSAVIDEAATAEAAQRVADKLALLRRRGSRLQRIDSAPDRDAQGAGDAGAGDAGAGSGS